MKTELSVRDREEVNNDRLVFIEAIVDQIEHDPSKETECLVELATFFCDAPIHEHDELARALKQLLMALLKNREQAIPEVSHCPRCGAQTNGVMWKRHSDLCQNIDGTETELPDQAVKIALMILKRREVSPLDADIPF